ncbi:hypothetical protein D9758_007758 [Tetrapyrgos nigripes]|uniref:Uncharacterized protein n=1 Tax=Tetrapyrgos nigripes TaxID=182062 RepID=A0A8H5LIJ1_9AGAR|nr:hypothetical protein D9758_007758 [Tetrapyrgos nigripes]
MFGLITLVPPSKPFPLPLSDLATREELHYWLSKILLHTIAQAQPMPIPARPRMPNNLVTFINIILHLHKIGFPAHWLSQFLSDVISDKLHTTAPTYTGGLPVKLSERDRTVKKRKLHLAPWIPDFELILSSAYEMLPIPIFLPTKTSKDDLEIVPPEDIGRYQVKLKQWTFTSKSELPVNNDGNITLLFKSPPSPDITDLAAKVVEKLIWRMRKSRFEKMKREGWFIVPIRSDMKEPAAYGVPATRCKEIVNEA